MNETGGNCRGTLHAGLEKCDFPYTEGRFRPIGNMTKRELLVIWSF